MPAKIDGPAVGLDLNNIWFARSSQRLRRDSRHVDEAPGSRKVDAPAFSPRSTGTGRELGHSMPARWPTTIQGQHQLFGEVCPTLDRSDIGESGLLRCKHLGLTKVNSLNALETNGSVVSGKRPDGPRQFASASRRHSSATRCTPTPTQSNDQRFSDGYGQVRAAIRRSQQPSKVTTELQKKL